MAGGKGSRLGHIEKPLLEIQGKKMIERVVRAVDGSKKINVIKIAVSKWTPNTKEWAKRNRIHTIETSGKGYVNDLSEVLNKLDGKIIVLPSDIPYITTDIIDIITEIYEETETPAMSVIVSKSFKKSIGLPAEEEMEFTGFNIIDSNFKGEMPQKNICLDRLEVAINVNTFIDLMHARLWRNELEESICK